MKTIIRNGKEYKVSNKLYEEINRLGLLEADVTSNPQNQKASDSYLPGFEPKDEQLEKLRSEAIKKGLNDRRVKDAYIELVTPLYANMNVFVSQLNIYNQKLENSVEGKEKDNLITLFKGLMQSLTKDTQFIDMVIRDILYNPELKSNKAKREKIVNYIIEQGDKQNFGKNELKMVQVVLTTNDFNKIKNTFNEIITGDYNASNRQLNYYRYNVIKGSVRFLDGIDPRLNVHMIDYPTGGWNIRLSPLKGILSLLNHYQLSNEEVETIKRKMPELKDYKFNSKDVLSDEEQKNNKEQLTLAFRILLYSDDGVKKFLCDNLDAIAESLIKRKFDPSGKDWMRIYSKLWGIILPKIHVNFINKIKSKDLNSIDLPYDTENPVKGFVKTDKEASRIWGMINNPQGNLW